MTQQQQALAEVLQKYGRNNFAKIPLHTNDYTDGLTTETVAQIKSLPYAFDDTNEIKYSVRRVDQVVNLEVWK